MLHDLGDGDELRRVPQQKRFQLNVLRPKYRAFDREDYAERSNNFFQMLDDSQDELLLLNA